MTAPERRSTAPPSPAAPAPGEIDGLQAELARIREELGTRDARLSRLGRTVAELDERCAGLRQELAARQEELDRLAGENRRYATDLSGGRDEIVRLSAEVEHLASEVRDLHASTSWRVTGPMRGLKNAVLRLRSGLRGTPSSEMPPAPPARAVENPDAVLVARSGLFDPDHYAAQAPGLRERGVDLVTHYLARGDGEGLDPNPVFDSSFYLKHYPDVATSGENPLVHYLRAGAAECRDPHPLFETSFYLE